MEPEGFQGIHQSRIKRFVYIIVGALCVSIGFYLVLVAVFIICGFLPCSFKQSPRWWNRRVGLFTMNTVLSPMRSA